MSPQEEFKRDLTRVLRRLRADRLRVHIAPETGLWRPRPRSHFHPAPEFFVQTGGATEFECPGGKFRAGTGDVCVMPRGVPHAETPCDTRTAYGVLVCIYQRDRIFLHRGRADPARRIQGYGTMLVPGDRTRDALRYMDDMRGREHVPRAERRRYVNALVEVFLLTLLGELARPAPAPQGDSPLVVEVEKLVHTQLANPELGIAALAKNLGCSPDHLSRCFHHERGTTLASWIQNERVLAARTLLKESRYNIAEVGWACGFATPSYFIRVFRARTGMTPRTFREQMVK
ncbi:MAG: helix-turn-helix domain-containing protein [Opitutaceae bacterium]|jgi:AraC-like DNA-binding protein|nr:helix-turn-helix domain-containing protein [Opitutaceae bacterium]